MSDTLTNALAQSARSSNVLQGIMNPAVVNPLAGMGSAITAVSGMQGLAESAAKQRAGQAFLNSIDPATGQPNQSLLLQNLQKDPSTAYAAQASAQAGQTLDADTYKLHSTRIAQASDALGSLIGRFPNGIPGDEFHKAIDQELSTGLITPAIAQQLHGTVTPDPKQNSIAATQLYFHNMNNGQQLERMYGTRPSVSTGAATVFPTVPAPGAGEGPVIPHEQTPQEKQQIVKIGTDANGKDIMGTQQQAQNLAAGRAMNDNGPAPAGPLGTGRPLPPALTNQNKPPPAAETPPPTTTPAASSGVNPLPGGGFTVGQGPAATSAQGATGTASAGKFQDIVAQGVAARSQDALLATMLSEAQGFRPGPGADLAATVKRTVLGLGAQFGTTFGVDTDKLAKQESVAKIGNQLADAQGAGSDARLRVNEGANPSLHNTPAGLDLIIRQLRGNTDYLRVRQQLAAAYPNKADVEGFESKIGANLDPRVFQYERLQPSQRRDYFNGLTDKDAFIKAHDWAAQQKLIGGGGG